jgi:hypothetical protein
VTVNPYLGYDSIRPFIERDTKGVFILCLTSNAGHKDFQMLKVGDKPLYQIVAEKVAFWNKSDNLGLVVGATAPEQLRDLRQIAGSMPLLIPGVGAQGGSLEKAVSYGTSNFTETGLINVSRSVLYASRDNDFADRALAELTKLNNVVDGMRPRGDQPAGAQPAAPQPVAVQPAAPQPAAAQPAGEPTENAPEPVQEPAPEPTENAPEPVQETAPETTENAPEPVQETAPETTDETPKADDSEQRPSE